MCVALPFAQCFPGWNRRTFCSSPNVFDSMGLFLEATQSIEFLCNICGVTFADASASTVKFFSIPQPLQKSTRLLLRTSQATAAANPTLMVARTLPRSVADFVLIKSSRNLTQELELSLASPSGSYWVAVYANSHGSFQLSADRESEREFSLTDEVGASDVPCFVPSSCPALCDVVVATRVCYVRRPLVSVLVPCRCS